MPLVGKHFDVGVEMRPHLPTAPENMSNVVFRTSSGGPTAKTT